VSKGGILNKLKTNTMNTIENRLEYTLSIGAFFGTDEEIYVALSQVNEAINELRRLRDKCNKLNKRIFELESNQSKNK